MRRSTGKQIASVVSLHRNDKIRMASFLAMTRVAGKLHSNDKNRGQIHTQIKRVFVNYFACGKSLLRVSRMWLWASALICS